MARGQGLAQTLLVHPGHHQHFARFLALGDGRNQAVLVEFDRRQEAGVGEHVRHVLSLSSPFSRSAIRSPASSRPAWMRRTGPSALKGRTVRWIWAGMIRLSNPPQE